MTKEVGGTYHDYGKVSEKIDYIYTTEEFTQRTVSVEKWTDSHAGIYLSDHYPICITIKD